MLPFSFCFSPCISSCISGFVTTGIAAIDLGTISGCKYGSANRALARVGNRFRRSLRISAPAAPVFREQLLNGTVLARGAGAAMPGVKYVVAAPGVFKITAKMAAAGAGVQVPHGDRLFQKGSWASSSSSRAKSESVGTMGA